MCYDDKFYDEFHDRGLIRQKNATVKAIFALDIISRFNLVPAHGSILDVGCGTGKFMEIFLKREYEIKGVDISDKFVQMCKEKGLVCKKCDIDTADIPFKENFDLVTMLDVAEHLKYPGKALIKISSSLKINGYLLIAFMNSNWIPNYFLKIPNVILKLLRKNRFLEFQPFISSGSFNVGHLHSFTVKNFKRIIPSNLFIEKIIPHWGIYHNSFFEKLSKVWFNLTPGIYLILKKR